MKTISKTFGKIFKFQLGNEKWEITDWELTDKGIALYRQGTYVGTVLKESDDYKQLKHDLRANSVEGVS